MNSKKLLIISIIVIICSVALIVLDLTDDGKFMKGNLLTHVFLLFFGVYLFVHYFKKKNADNDTLTSENVEDTETKTPQ